MCLSNRLILSCDVALLGNVWERMALKLLKLLKEGECGSSGHKFDSHGAQKLNVLYYERTVYLDKMHKIQLNGSNYIHLSAVSKAFFCGFGFLFLARKGLYHSHTRRFPVLRSCLQI